MGRLSPEGHFKGRGRALLACSCPAWGKASVCITQIPHHCPAWEPLGTPPPFPKEDPMLREGKPPTPRDIGGRSGVRIGTVCSLTPPSTLDSHMRREKESGRGMRRGRFSQLCQPSPDWQLLPGHKGLKVRGGGRRDGGEESGAGRERWGHLSPNKGRGAKTQSPSLLYHSAYRW